MTAPPALRYRRIGEADLPRLMEIEAAGFRHPWSEQLLRNELAHAWSVMLAAVEGAGAAERIVGYVIFWLVHDEVHVLNVATAPEARRRGVGRALLSEAHAWGRRKACRLVTLEVRRSNLPALTLYRALGYKQVGVRPNYYTEEGEDAIVMTLDLDPR
ncbi:MAG TPA: ribosomal protein S18-alanine N-acetyltransferase [Anaeromyxobacteraceae bacterium]|nr:ribosomal protein S18-alanine N-acetyltransferase [Anaeromyxobacteraceae bacterium]